VSDSGDTEAAPIEPLRVLCATNMYPTDRQPTAGVFVERQVTALRALGHEVDVAVVEGWRTRRAYVGAMGALARRSRRGGYDVVHAHYGLTGLSAAFVGAPLVVTLHGSDALVGRVQPFLSRIACRRADAVIAVSSAIAERVAGVCRPHADGTPSVHVIPCGVDLWRFRSIGRATAQERLALDPAHRYVLFPFDPARSIKRADIAQAVIDRLRESDPEVELLVASSVPHTEMPLYYAAADVMLLCSDSEGSPTSVKESLACNTPVVSVDVGGVREILDGVPGCTVCERDVDALASAVRTTLDRQTPFSGRDRAERFDERAVARRVTNVYADVIRRRRSA
jgi:glycosyltransferase involved in cell wall biosynthesis